jgi:O-antigen/teichoic acid export membrane protein
MNGSFITQISIVVYLVKFQNLGAYGYVKGFWIANAIWFLPSLILTFRDAQFLPKKEFFKIPLDYSAPLSFAGIVEGFGTVLDRYFSDKFIPLATIGFYSLARQFGAIVNVINSLTKLMFVPYIYKINAIKNNAAAILADFSVIYIVLMTVPVIAVCTMGQEIVTVLDPTGRYLPLVEYIPAFAFSFYFISMATIMGRGMDLAGVTKWTFLVPFVGIIVSLAIYKAMLPEYGVWGILWSVVLGSFARNLVNIVLAVYFFPRKLYLHKLFYAWGIAAVFYALITFVYLPNVWLSALFKVTAVMVMAALQIRLVLYETIMNILEPLKSKKEAI